MAGVLLVVLVPHALAETHPQASGTGGEAAGYDISWPQCGGSYPAKPAFGVVGVNKGIVFKANPCLADQLTWAGGASAGLYANTGNPGPELSSRWPLGQWFPKICKAADPDTAECAYDYGYNAAADSYADAQAAFTALGLAESPATSGWWLDVETSNSWRDDVSLNVAALQGAVYFLGSFAEVATIGFYSTQYQWNVITGGTTAFAAYPSWVAGAPDAQGAAAKCVGPGFTGGGVALAQYPIGRFDGNMRCTGAAPVLTTIRVSPAAASVPTSTPQQFTATALDQFGQPVTPQPALTWSASGGGAIDRNGRFTAGPTAGGPSTVFASSGDLSGAAGVIVVATPTLATITVSPASDSVPTDGARQLIATAYDQTGQPLNPQPAFAWSVDDGGTIGPTGLFTAGSTAGGPFWASASSGTVSGTAGLTVTTRPPQP